jgi:lipid-A-disaccharide synthase
MSVNNKHIFIVAGEASGDMHAAHLVSALQALDPSFSFSGLGGEMMAEKGVHLYNDLTKISVVGFAEVLKHYSEFKRIFDETIRHVDRIKPAAVVLVDYPGFNLRLAKQLKKRGHKIIYYISPQVWAWKKKRINLIRCIVDKMLVLFEFEKDFYAREGIEVEFVGHPLIDSVVPTEEKTKFLKKIGLTDFRMTIGLLPGSREKEVERHLPVMLAAASLLARDFPMLQFLVIQAPTISDVQIQRFTAAQKEIRLKTVKGEGYNAINASDCCVVASGTATLETALLLKPMVVIYKTSWLTWFLAKLFVKIPNIGLVNVVAGKRIVPECIQNTAIPARIAKELKEIFTNELRVEAIKDELSRVRKSLGSPGANIKAANVIRDFIDNINK